MFATSYITRNTSKSIPWLAVFISLLGALYCLYGGSDIGADELCPTAGCKLYSDFTIFGISLWWIGAAGFLSITLACLTKHVKLAYTLSALGVVADIPLLILLAFTAPCLLCMGVALFLVACFIVLRRKLDFPLQKGVMPAFLLIWLCFFVVNSVNVLDGMAGPWIIHGPENALVQVSFSPSCPACRQAILGFADTPNIAYLPVAEKDGDIESIAYLQAELAKGTPFLTAFIDSLIPETVQQHSPSFLEKVVLQARTLRNKSRILRQGFGQLPLISINGAPSSLGMGAGAGSSSGGTFDLGTISYCEQDSPEPCDEPLN